MFFGIPNVKLILFPPGIGIEVLNLFPTPTLISSATRKQGVESKSRMRLANVALVSRLGDRRIRTLRRVCTKIVHYTQERSRIWALTYVSPSQKAHSSFLSSVHNILFFYSRELSINKESFRFPIPIF